MAQKDLSFPLLCLWKNGAADGNPEIVLNSDELNRWMEEASFASGYEFKSLIDHELEFYEVSAGMKLKRVYPIAPPKIVKWSKK